MNLVIVASLILLTLGIVGLLLYFCMQICESQEEGDRHLEEGLIHRQPRGRRG